MATSVYASELAQMIAVDLGGADNALDEAALTALVNLLSERIDSAPPYLAEAQPILRALYNKFTLNAALPAQIPDAIHLLTVHKSKGLSLHMLPHSRRWAAE